MPRYPAPRAARSQGGPNRRLMVGIGIGIVLLALGASAVVAMTILSPREGMAATSPSQEPSPSPTPSPTPIPSPTPSEEPSPSAAATPTPAATPAGPPQEVPVGAWARVAVDELSVRRSAGTDAAADYILVRGAVVHVAEGPAVLGGLNWYRIASLGGAVGWAFSGWQEEPFMTTLVNDPTLIRCGEVASPVFDVVGGQPTPNDPVRIGDMALPAAAFSDLALGALELLRGVNGEACFSAQLGTDGAPIVSVQLSVSACGHAVSDGSFFRLRPAGDQDVPFESQVKDPAIIHPVLLLGGPSEDRLSSNLRGIVSMMANGDDATGCLQVNVTEDAGGSESYRGAYVAQCSIVSEYNADNLRLTPADGGYEVWIKLTSQGSEPGIFPMGDPVAVGVSVNVSDDSRDAYAYPGYGLDCG